MAEVWVIKLIALTLLLVAALIFGLLPLKFANFLSSRRLNGATWPLRMTSLLNCFAGGVFLGTTFLHLIPEVRAGFEDVWSTLKMKEMEFPLAEFIIVCGFFLVVFIENGILTVKKHRETEINPDPITHKKRKPNRPDSHGSIRCHADPDSDQVENINQDACTECNVNIEEGSGDNYLHVPSESSVLLENNNPSSAPVAELSSVLLLLALCLHTVFEGLALGLLSSQTKIWELFAAIAIHKIMISFSLGLRIAEFKDKCKSIACIVIFACMTPIGVVIGTVITEANINPIRSKIANSVLQGIASGTFLQVVFFEILHKELVHRSNLWNLLLTVTGFGVMAVLTKYLPS